jgi:hypothetical protein
VVSMSTGRWPELSAEHVVRYTGEVSFLAITMSKISGVTKGLYGSVDYTTADQDGCTAPCCRSICAVADIVGKPEGLTLVEVSLT